MTGYYKALTWKQAENSSDINHNNIIFGPSPRAWEITKPNKWDLVKIERLLTPKRDVKVTQLCPTPYSPGNSPGQNTGVAIFSLLQGIFPTQELNPGLPHCRQTLYQLSHKGILFHPDEDHKLNEKITFRTGGNIWKQCNWQGINLQNIQTAHEAQYIYYNIFIIIYI